MKVSIAMVVAGALIAAATAMTSHWSISGNGGGALRLNRWTGDVIWCGTSSFQAPAVLDCTAK
jgi:hypothetical protein